MAVLVFLVAVGTLAFAAYVWELAPPAAPNVGEGARVLPVPLAIEDFALVDHEGAPFDRSRLEGHWSVLFFGYTYCPDICPLTLQRLAAVQPLLAEDGIPSQQVVFVSVDPDRDRERIREYIAYFDPSFIAATGDPAQIERLARSVGAFHEKARQEGDDYLINHSSVLFLVDPSAKLRAVLEDPHDPQEYVELLARVQSLPTVAAGPEVEVTDAWIREPPPGTNAAGYLTLANNGSESRTLVAVRSLACPRIELHRSVVQDGVARMQRVEAIDVPAGESVALTPEGLHLMLIGPKALKDGDRVELVLELSDGETLTTTAVVRRGGAHSGHH